MRDLRPCPLGLLAFALLGLPGGACPETSAAQRSLQQNPAVPETNPQTSPQTGSLANPQINPRSGQRSDPDVAYPAGADREPSTELPPSGQTLHVAVGQSLVLTSTEPLRRIYVGNPAVLQTFTSGLTEIVLTPKTAGASSLIVWDAAGRRRLYSVSADLDPGSLRASLSRAFPGAAIEAEARDGKIYLSGSVANDTSVDAAFKLASLFSKDVVNSIRVIPPPVRQVEMKLRIVEVDRTKMEQFGINIFAGGNNVIGTTTGQYNTGQSGVGTSTLTTSDPLNLLFYNFNNAFGVSIKDLAQRDILQVLAEPTLVTISGLPARFLSGGEFPVPVVQGGLGTTAAITVVYRPYGVKVDFTPTVNDDGSIRLKIAPEVSTLDYTNAVTISGFSIPALATRRAETEVQIRDGQTFMISGLLDHRTTENMARIPGIADVPILGELFKSKGITHSITELVLIVTATVVDPLTSHTTPTDPKMATPNMQSQTFDAAGKAAASAKASEAAKPETSKP